MKFYMGLELGVDVTKLGIPPTTLLPSSAPIFAVLLPIYHHHPQQEAQTEKYMNSAGESHHLESETN